MTSTVQQVAFTEEREERMRGGELKEGKDKNERGASPTLMGKTL